MPLVCRNRVERERYFLELKRTAIDGLLVEGTGLRCPIELSCRRVRPAGIPIVYINGYYPGLKILSMS